MRRWPHAAADGMAGDERRAPRAMVETAEQRLGRIDTLVATTPRGRSDPRVRLDP